MLKFISESDRIVRNHSERDRIVRNHSGFLCPVHRSTQNYYSFLHHTTPPHHTKNTGLYPVGRFSPSRPYETTTNKKIIYPVLAWGKCTWEWLKIFHFAFYVLLFSFFCLLFFFCFLRFAFRVLLFLLNLRGLWETGEDKWKKNRQQQNILIFIESVVL